jgi:hypothetical protein
MPFVFEHVAVKRERSSAWTIWSLATAGIELTLADGRCGLRYSALPRGLPTNGRPPSRD